MFEIALAIGLVVVIVKVADNEGQPTFVWGLLTTLACIGSMFLIPWPFLRVLGAGILVFIAMTVANAMSARKS